MRILPRRWPSARRILRYSCGGRGRAVRYARGAGRHGVDHSFSLAAAFGGTTQANWLLLTGEQIGAEDALRCGIVTRVVPKDRLDVAIDDAVAAILSCGPDSVREQKKLLRSWENQPLNEAISGTIPLFAKAYASGEPQRYLRTFVNAHRDSLNPEASEA